MSRNEGNNKSLRRKVRNSYIISTISIALVLFLLGSVGYLILNARRATNQMKESMTVNVMLKDLDREQKDAIGSRLEGMDVVRDAKFISKEEAADSFKEHIGNDFVEFLQFNPLPDSYQVHLKAEKMGQKDIKALDREVASWEGVDEVVYQKNVASDITRNVNKFNIIMLLFGAGLLFISLILLNNTLRLTIYSKRYVINTMKMVGASKWFIMKPFVGRSVLHGFYAWFIAAVMFLGLVMALGEGLLEMTMLLDNRPVYIILGLMLAGGLLISVLFTTFAVNKFVNMHSSKIYLY